MKRCSECDVAITHDDDFCHECLTNLEHVEEDTERYFLESRAELVDGSSVTER